MPLIDIRKCCGDDSAFQTNTTNGGFDAIAPPYFRLNPEFPTKRFEGVNAGLSLGNSAERHQPSADTPVCRSLDVKGCTETSSRMMSNGDPDNFRMFSGTLPAIHYKQSIRQPATGEKG